jgi:hypothetical protein
MFPRETKVSGGKPLTHSDLRDWGWGGGVFIEKISSSKHYSKKDYKEKMNSTATSLEHGK